MGPRSYVVCSGAAGDDGGCERANGAKGTAPPPAPAVVVAQVLQRTVPIVRDFTARTDAVPTVEVRARVAGVPEEYTVAPGSGEPCKRGHWTKVL